MSGKRSGFVRDAFHQIAIAADPVCKVIDDGVARLVEARGEPCFGHRHSDRVAEALAKRTGGDLDAWRVTALRMTRRLALPLAETLDFRKRKIVARQVQEAVTQHG